MLDPNVIGPLDVLLILLVSVTAGIIGAVFGLGGGIIIVPFLSLAYPTIPFPVVAGASIVSVVATSSASAATYVRDRVTNIRLGMFLEMSTVAGALMGATVSAYFPDKFLRIFFGVLLAVVATIVIWDRKIDIPKGVVGDRIARKLRLGGQYHDHATGEIINYDVTRTPITFSLSYFAGIVSGLLGVGGGVVKVPAMNLVSRVPVKVASATSNFMIGVTAAASATVYLSRGEVYALLVAPLMLGVVVGATIGTRVLHVAPPKKVKATFGLILIVTSALLILRGLGVHI